MQHDPVCGTEVDPTHAIHAAYQGQTYAFCSIRCKQVFENDPATYTAQAVSSTGFHQRHYTAYIESVGQPVSLLHLGDAKNQFGY